MAGTIAGLANRAFLGAPVWLFGTPSNVAIIARSIMSLNGGVLMDTSEFIFDINVKNSDVRVNYL